jgi:nicotinamide-nucleotide amidase
MPTTSLSTEIVTTGTEILLGEIVDTNAAWIAQQLREAGVNLYYKTTVGDNEARLRGVLELGMTRSDVIIVTGGLGPTADDITRQAIANATGRPLLLREDALATLQERFAHFGVTMTDNNRQQAYIPEGATMIKNPVGTAPGFIVEGERSTVIALPGVPREMKHLMTETVLPYLRARSGNTGIIRRHVLHTVGIGESTLDSQIADLMAAANPSVGLAAHTAQVDIRITARAETADAAEALIDTMEATIRARVGDCIYSNVAEEVIETVVARLLHQQHQTIAIVETNTGGAVAQRLSTALPDVDPVVGAWTVGVDTLPAGLAEPVTEATLPSEALARQCAETVRQQSGATFGLAMLGTRGADEGTYGLKRGETWIALAAPEETLVRQQSIGGRDEYTRVRLSNGVLSLLWHHLRG